jgi:hypothetical protein
MESVTETMQRTHLPLTVCHPVFEQVAWASHLFHPCCIICQCHDEMRHCHELTWPHSLGANFATSSVHEDLES